jgi:hypothetical protein
MGINLVTKDGSGNQFHPAALYTLNFSYLIGAGCEKAEILLPNEKDLPSQLDDLRIYDNTELLWLGRIEDEPLVTESGEVLLTAVGYASHLKDELVQKLWVDSGTQFWDSEIPWEEPESWNWTLAEKDNNNRVFIRLPTNGIITVNSRTGMWYRLTSSVDGTNQAIYSITFDYEVGAGYNDAVGKLHLYSYTGGSGAGEVSEWSLTGSGASSGSTGVTITAAKTEMAFQFDGIGTFTIANDTYWAKITNIRVNGSSDFTGTVTSDALIKDIIPDFAPSISTDFSDIDTGTATITDFYAENPNTPLGLTQNAVVGEDWKTGIYEVGSDNKPRYKGKGITRDTIDWFVSVDDGPLDIAGKSIQEMFNSVVVEYLTQNGSVQTLTRTATIPLFDSFGITKEARIRVNTTSQTAAEEAGDQFLTEFGRPRAKGQMILKGPILSKYGNRPAWFIRPNDILQIQDLDASPDTLADMSESTVTNGINIFEVIAVDVNISGSEESVTIQLETPASRLDFELVNL